MRRMKELWYLKIFFLPISVSSLVLAPGAISRGPPVVSSTATSTTLHSYFSGPDKPPPSYALLVDAENASPGSFDLAMADLIERRGIQMPIRRIFGKARLLEQASWQAIIHDYSLIPTYVAPEGLADMDLAIHAMDIMYTKKDYLQGFVLFSSDADFTRLVQRLRENNLPVLGVGQRGKTNDNETLAKACYEFVYTEDLELRAQQEAMESQEGEKEEKEEEEEDRETGRQQVLPAVPLEIEQIEQDKLSAKEKTLQGRSLRLTRQLWESLYRAYKSVSKGEDTGPPNDDQPQDNQQNHESLLLDSSAKSKPTSGMKTEATAPTELDTAVETLKNDLHTLAPNNTWINLSLLTQRSSISLENTGYKRMKPFVQAQSDHFDLKLKKSTYFVRRRRHR